MYGRMTRLVEQAVFALGRAGSETLIEADLQKEWMKASGDFERDGLSQTFLRELVIGFKFKMAAEFGAIFHGQAPAPIYRAAQQFFGDYQRDRKERNRIVYVSLSLACLLIAEDRYEIEKRTLPDRIEKTLALRRIIHSEDEMISFLSLCDLFTELRTSLLNSDFSTVSQQLSDDRRPATGYAN